MLKQSLIAKTSPKVREENVVCWKNYRVSVLGDRLFRLERSEKQIFRDEATQSVWFRDMPAQAFQTEFKEKECIVQTKACRLVLKEDRRSCYVEYDGKRYPIKNRKNLGGTYRTLDQCDGEYLFENLFKKEESPFQKVDLGAGVCSRTGIAVFDDAQSLTLGQDGEVKPIRGDGTDEYVFVYGDDYRGAVCALYAVCGATPRIPRYALGNWWSRYHDYTDREYLTLLDTFAEREVPLTVATIDMDWHYSVRLDEEFGITEKGMNTPFYGGNSGWTGYSWNKRLFPDYRAFLKKIEERNLKITLNVHPADGVRWWEDMYEEMAVAMGKDGKNAEQIAFDFTDTSFINAYFDVVHKPYERDGVAFWWIDWQQGTKTSMEGLDPLWSLNHYHYLDIAENHAAPLILSRYAGIGSHRYPLGFSGDTAVTWATLRYLPYFTATASNVGYTWWSHDIGGHMCGEQGNELYLRHIQYGVFSPINRLHCSNASTMTKEPWAYENGAGSIAEKWLRLRHSMIPFLYTKSYDTHKAGRALVEPLYYEWKEAAAYRYKEEYLFGGLLVAAVTSPLKRDGYARAKVWLPEGTWTDIFTGDCYTAPKGGKETVFLRTMESIPVLAKSGTVLPFSMDGGNGVNNPVKLRVDVYSGEGEFTLYEDGREYGDTREAFTKFQAKQEKGERCKQTLCISSYGEISVLPKNRLLRVSFKNITDGEIALYKNGERQEIERLYLEEATVEFFYDASASYEITVSFCEETTLEKQIKRARRILLSAEGDHNVKVGVFQRLQSATTEQELWEVLEGSSLPKGVKERITEGR